MAAIVIGHKDVDLPRISAFRDGNIHRPVLLRLLLGGDSQVHDRIRLCLTRRRVLRNDHRIRIIDRAAIARRDGADSQFQRRKCILRI